MAGESHRLRLFQSPKLPQAVDLQGLRVLLINPPQSYPLKLVSDYQSYMPVGLAMIAAVLEGAGASVRCIDCLAYNDAYEAGDKARFGLGERALLDAIREHAPHVVGITNPFTAFLDDALRTARLVKHVARRIPVVLGGIEASLPSRNRALLRRCSALDVLVVGEGEVTIVDLLSKFDRQEHAFVNLQEVAGIVYRDGGEIHSTPDRGFIKEIDTLPLPAYHLFDLDRMYRNPFYARYRGGKSGVRCIPMHTSRGCPYSCNFCSVHSQVGKAHRRHSVEYVRRHIEHVRERYRVNHIHFEDDNLTLNTKHSLEFFESISDFGLGWDTPNGTRADSITPELARVMARSGARSVSIAVESGNQAVLDRIVNKRLGLDDVVNATRNLRDAGIPTVVFLIIGFPGETEQDVRDTLRFGRKLAMEYGTVNLIFVATPLPDTALYAECEKYGFLTRELDNESLLSAIRLNQAPLIETAEFNKSKLYAWARDELDDDALYTRGWHIPVFFARNAAALENAAVVLGGPPLERLPCFWGVPTELVGSGSLAPDSSEQPQFS